MGIPLVFFGRTCLSDKFSCVMANGDEAAQEATQHLLDTGSRRIAFIGGPNHLDMVKRRKHGYLEALRENRVPIERELVVCEKIDYDWALEATTKLLEMENRPDAILAFNDIITFAAFTAIKQKGLDIPKDVALIGFTDDVHAKYVTPKMSAIEDQSFEMGVQSCKLLLKSINGDSKICKKIVPQKLVIREALMAFRTAKTVTPTSAKTANHIVAMPMEASKSTATLTTMAKTTFCLAMAIVLRAMRIAVATFEGWSSISTTSAASMAASLPSPPIAMPTSARANTGASLIPSPTKAMDLRFANFRFTIWLRSEVFNRKS